MSNIIILIPPSEGKASGGSLKPLGKVSSHVNEMLTRLQSVKDDEWGKLLGVKGKALDQAIEANTSILASPCMPAIKRYTGVVYNGIDYDGLSKKGQAFFDHHVSIISALFGLVKSQDAIPDYKLKIDKLKADKYWQPILAKAFEGKFVIDLLPQAHRKAISYHDGIEVEFIIQKNGKKVSAGHMGKHIKGRFVRWLCENQIVDSKDFKKFQEEGFVWDGQQFIKKAGG